MHAKHIVVIPSWYSTGRGAGGGYFRDQALALQAAGFRVAMLAPTIHTARDLRAGRVRHARDGAISVEHEGIPLYRRDARVRIPRVPYRNAATWSLCGLRLFAHYIAQMGLPDLVHAHCCLNGGVLALAINRRYGVPFIVTEHSTSFDKGRLRWWERDLVRRVISRAQQCIAVSPHLADLLEVQYPGSRWQYAPNVLGDVFLDPPLARGSADPFVFICAARMSLEKGHALLIDAFAEAFRGSPDTRLRLVGDGPTKSGVEQLCFDRGVAGQVDFLGALSSQQLRAELDAADAFVLASDVESFGVVVIEALASGLPAVITASGGPNHLIDASNGLLTPVQDLSALRQALIDMRRGARVYDRTKIHADAVDKYGPEEFARQFSALAQ